MSIADRIYETVKELSETSAGEVLDLAERLKAKQAEDEKMRKAKALATLDKYKGRYDGKPFDRDECYERGLSDTAETESNQDSFFSVAGIWKGRDVTLESLRAQAWRNNKA